MNCWHRIKSCPKGNGTDRRMVLVWHVYQHCMVYDAEKARQNRFIVRWREIPENEWIPVSERVPTSRDANVLGVVIVRDTHGDVRLRGWHLVAEDPMITDWMATPDEPDDYLELREDGMNA